MRLIRISTYAFCMLFTWMASVVVDASAQADEGRVLTLEGVVIMGPEFFRVTSAMHEPWKTRDSIAKAEYNAFMEQNPEDADPEIRAQVRHYKDGGMTDQFPSMLSLMLRYFADRRGYHLPVSIRPISDMRTTESLSEIAGKMKARFVVEIPLIEIVIKESDTLMTSEFFLFDSTKPGESIVMTAVGGMRNPGFEFACTDGSVDCLLNNTMAKMLNSILGVVNERDATLVTAKKTQNDRLRAVDNLMRSHTGSFALEMRALSANYDMEGFVPFFSMVSPDSMKFILFAEQLSTTNTELSIEEHLEKSRQVQMDIDAMNDEDHEIRPVHVTYYGVFDRGEWHVAESGRTVRSIEDIHENRKAEILSALIRPYFNEGDTTISSRFWDSGFFERVTDITKDPKYERYKSMYEDDARKDKAYIGWYRITANSYQENFRKMLDKRKAAMRKDVFAPMMHSMRNDWVPLERFKQDSLLTLITPSDMSMWIAPIVGTSKSGDTTLRFYAWNETERTMYRWTRLAPTKPSRMDNFTIREEMDKISDWHYGYDAYDDERFWKEEVLAIENGKFKYLEPVR